MGVAVLLAAALLGLSLWLGYNAWQADGPLRTFRTQQEPPFERTLDWPHLRLVRTAPIVIDSEKDSHERVLNTLDLTAAFLLLAGSGAAIARLRPSYAAYVLLSTAFLLTGGRENLPLWSVSRFALVVFPLYWLLAMAARPPWAERLLSIVFPTLLGVLLSLFVNWYFVA